MSNSQNEKIKEFIKKLAEGHLLAPDKNSVDEEDWPKIELCINILYDFCDKMTFSYFAYLLEETIAEEYGLNSKIENKLKEMYLGRLSDNAKSYFSAEALKNSQNTDYKVVQLLENYCKNDKFNNFIHNLYISIEDICNKASGKSNENEMSYNQEQNMLSTDDVDRLRKTLEDWQKYMEQANKDAQSAKDAAGKARNEADNAKGIAEQANKDAQSAKDAAGKARNEADNAKGIAEQANKDAQSAKDAAVEARHEADNAKDAANKAAKSAAEALPSLLTAVGIFMAILTAIAAGYLSYKVSFSSYFAIQQAKYGFLILTGQILTNFVFAFMFMLSRILNKSIAVQCIGFEQKKPDGKQANKNSEEDKRCSFECSDCTKGSDINWKFLAVHKYPYIWYPNILMILGYMVVFIWWYVEYHLYNDFSNSIENFFVRFIILVLLILAILLFCFLFFKKPKEKK